MRGELSPNFFQTLWISMVQTQTKPEFLRFTQCKKQLTVSKFHNIAIIVFAAPVWTKLDSSCTYDFLWMNFQVMLMVIHPWTSTPKGLQSESQGTTPYYLQPFFSHARAEGTRVSSLVQLYHAMRITTNCFHETFVQTILTTIVAENNVSKQWSNIYRLHNYWRTCFATLCACRQNLIWNHWKHRATNWLHSKTTLHAPMAMVYCFVFLFVKIEIRYYWYDNGFDACS